LAVASSVPNRAGALIVTLGRMEKELADQPSASRLRLLKELAELVGGRQDRREVADVLEALVKLPGKDKAAWQMAGVEGLGEGMGRRGTQLGVFLASLPEARKPLVEQTTALLGQAADVAVDRKRRPDDRLPAVRLLAHAPWKTAGPALIHLVTDETAQEIRLAAVRVLASHPRPEVAAARSSSARQEGAHHSAWQAGGRAWPAAGRGNQGRTTGDCGAEGATPRQRLGRGIVHS
jgi:hypothetical protein